MAIRNADTAGREETCQPAFRAPPPANLSPFPSSQQRFGSDRELIRDVVLAGPSRLRDGEDQSTIAGINVLASRQTHPPPQTALTQSLTERPAGAVPGIGKDAAETRARGDDAVDLLDRDLRLCQSGPPILRHARPRHALGIICPALGRNSRRPTITGTSRDANVNETSD